MNFKFDEFQKSMGASFVAINHSLRLLDKTQPLSILDAGSGFSSLAFHSINDYVTTIDNPAGNERHHKAAKNSDETRQGFI